MAEFDTRNELSKALTLIYFLSFIIVYRRQVDPRAVKRGGGVSLFWRYMIDGIDYHLFVIILITVTIVCL